MAEKRSAINPFYVLLVVFGIAFTLTACAYVVMMLKALHPEAGPAPQGGSLLDFVDRHGTALLTAELLLLALSTVGAISTDRYWMRRQSTSHRTHQPPPRPDRPSNAP
ncbi:MAG TPA: hypothetical protein PK867_19505 [Pirellulales bacterium]|nr:hypothetical protein [Pirellulales bacterium]